MYNLELSSVYSHRYRSTHQSIGHAKSRFNDPSIEAHYPPDIEIEPIHLDIDMAVDLEQESVSGTVTTTVEARCYGPSVLKLDAIDFEINDVHDVDEKPCTWRYDGSKLIIHWQQPFDAKEQRRIAISYQVTKPVNGIIFSKPNESYPNQPWYAATDHETERARHWLPCLDLPNVRTTLDFHLRAESRFTILANGALAEEVEHEDGTKTAHWQLAQRSPSYLACFAISDFVKADDGVFNDGEKDVALAYFCSQEHSADNLLRTFGRTRAMMAWMTQKLDMPFPYPKYYQFTLPEIGGAMENISLTSWTERLLQDETLAQEYGWLVDQINVHEMAHSYFGDAIVCRDFAHAWLKESWATYIEQCWREDSYNQDEALYVYYINATSYFDESDYSYSRPIMTRHFRTSWDLYDRHLYEGGACRLHTLRCELGDEIFWAATQDYLRRYSEKVVETDDFRAVFEEHSGRSLGKFFDQWFHTAGYPDIKLSFAYDEKKSQGTFEIEQKQVDAKKGVPAFELSTDVSWRIDDVDYQMPVKLNQAKHTFVISMDVEPQQVRFDPGCKALHKLSFNPGDPMLRHQLTEAKDIIGRIQAAKELVKTGKRLNIQAVIDAYAAEPFWGVRREMALALGEANAEVALEGLVQIIAEEQEPMVLAYLFRAARQYRDSRICDALVKRLQGDLPYIATQAAYQALGAQRRLAQKESAWQCLLDGARQESFNGIAQSGALWSLAATRHADAVDLLLERVGYGATPNYARPLAISGLADIGKGQEKANREKIVETLIDLLRDPWENVRWAAVRALGTMKATEAIDALDGYARSIAHQDRVTVERTITALQNSDKADGSAMKKQVEKLQEKVRKLEDQVQKIEAQKAS